MKYKEEEHNEQVALIQWWAEACKNYGIEENVLLAIPNGGMRAISVAIKLKAEGVRSGVPDLFLAYPKGDKCGLWLEMKKIKGGRASENQKFMMKVLKDYGYSCQLCHGWREAKRFIEEYLNEHRIVNE